MHFLVTMLFLVAILAIFLFNKNNLYHKKCLICLCIILCIFIIFAKLSVFSLLSIDDKIRKWNEYAINNEPNHSCIIDINHRNIIPWLDILPIDKLNFFMGNGIYKCIAEILVLSILTLTN